MEHGTVTSVKYEEGAVVCNVEAIRLNTEYKGIPVLKSHSSFIQVPKQGELVTMETLDDGTRFISNVLGKTGSYPAKMDEGELAIQLDEKTVAHFDKQKDGTFDVHLTSSGNLNLEAEGDINLTAAKQVNLDAPNGVIINGTDFDQHTHPYTDDEIADTGDGSGTETVQNKTTDSPS